MSTWCPLPLRNSSTVRTASGVPRAWKNGCGASRQNLHATGSGTERRASSCFASRRRFPRPFADPSSRAPRRRARPQPARSWPASACGPGEVRRSTSAGRTAISSRTARRTRAPGGLEEVAPRPPVPVGRPARVRPFAQRRHDPVDNILGHAARGREFYAFDRKHVAHPTRGIGAPSAAARRPARPAAPAPSPPRAAASPTDIPRHPPRRARAPGRPPETPPAAPPRPAPPAPPRLPAVAGAYQVPSSVVRSCGARKRTGAHR